MTERPVPKFARGGPRLRGIARSAWNRFEGALAPHRSGRQLLRLVCLAALRLQYRERCELAFVEGAWEYRWGDATIVSPLVALQWARPEQFGLDVGAGIEDVYCYEYLPRPGDTVLNIGAGVGCELFAFTRLVGPTGRVFAFEAHPRTFTLMERSAALNGWPNVELVHAAVADRSGTLLISDELDHTARSVLTTTGIEVPAVSIDDFLRDRQIERVDYLTMNIEGAERLAILGLEQSIGKISHICVACHDFLGDPDKATKLEVTAWLEQNGFAVVTQPRCPWVAVADFVYGRRAPAAPAVPSGPPSEEQKAAV